uniref:F-box domain-containing protein n=1 Tax=Rhabditophanes sp. KR3021 TaxID=114890 RepID=A0AC35TXR3_9BILA
MALSKPDSKLALSQAHIMEAVTDNYDLCILAKLGKTNFSLCKMIDNFEINKVSNHLVENAHFRMAYIPNRIFGIFCGTRFNDSAHFVQNLAKIPIECLTEMNELDIEISSAVEEPQQFDLTYIQLILAEIAEAMPSLNTIIFSFGKGESAESERHFKAFLSPFKNNKITRITNKLHIANFSQTSYFTEQVNEYEAFINEIYPRIREIKFFVITSGLQPFSTHKITDSIEKFAKSKIKFEFRLGCESQAHVEEHFATRSFGILVQGYDLTLNNTQENNGLYLLEKSLPFNRKNNILKASLDIFVTKNICEFHPRESIANFNVVNFYFEGSYDVVLDVHNLGLGSENLRLFKNLRYVSITDTKGIDINQISSFFIQLILALPRSVVSLSLNKFRCGIDTFKEAIHRTLPNLKHFKFTNHEKGIGNTLTPSFFESFSGLQVVTLNCLGQDSIELPDSVRILIILCNSRTKTHNEEELLKLKGLSTQHNLPGFKEALKTCMGSAYEECKCHQIKTRFKHNTVKIGLWNEIIAVNFASITDYLLYEKLSEITNYI